MTSTPSGDFPKLTALMSIEKQIADKQAEIAELNKTRDGVLSATWVQCRKCGLSHQIGALTYIQTHWYVRPYGCTEGDYWNQGEGQWDCPGCGTNNRLYDKPGIVALKRLFSKIHNCYCRTSGLHRPQPCEGCVSSGRTQSGLTK